MPSDDHLLFLFLLLLLLLLSPPTWKSAFSPNFGAMSSPRLNFLIVSSSVKSAGFSLRR